MACPKEMTEEGLPRTRSAYQNGTELQSPSHFLTKMPAPFTQGGLTLRESFLESLRHRFAMPPPLPGEDKPFWKAFKTLSSFAFGEIHLPFQGRQDCGTVKTASYSEMAVQQKRSGGRGKMKIRCRPERRRLRFGISVLSVESLFPLDRGNRSRERAVRG